MPRKIRELKAMLSRAGFVQISGGKGSHSKWRHPNLAATLTVSGQDGSDAQRYQEQYVEKAIRKAEGR